MEIQFDLADRAPTPEERCRISEVQVTVMKTSERLDPRLRTVFVLRDIEGLSIEETAAAILKLLARRHGQDA